MATGSSPAAAAPVISRTREPDTPPPAWAPAAPASEAGGTVVSRHSVQPAVAVPAAIQREASNVGDESEGAVRDMTDSRVAELGDRLFDHIRTRLRAELLVDRERAGLIGDVR